jgi:hypothetical protein
MGALLLSLIGAAPPGAVTQWSMTATANAGAVNFEVRYRDRTSTGTYNTEDGHDYQLADLETTFRGLTKAQLFSGGTDVHFTVTRQEGSLVCSGRAHGGVASGEYAFSLDPGFTAEMARRGVGTVSAEKQREWLIEGADVYGLLDVLKAQGFGVPDVAMLSRAIDHGLTAAYARDLAAAGVHASTLEQLVRAVDHGVTPRFVAALRANGLSGASRDQPIRLVVERGISRRAPGVRLSRER